MKRILPLFLALSATPLIQPTTAHAALSAKFTIEPAAKELMAKSAKAYSDLTGYSSHFETVKTEGDKTTTTTGNFFLSKPDKSKIDYTADGKTTIVVSNGEKVWKQTQPTVYMEDAVAKGKGLEAIAMDLTMITNSPYFDHVFGKGMEKTPVSFDLATVVPDNGVKYVGTKGAATFEFISYFDANTALISKYVTNVTVPDKKITFVTTFSPVAEGADISPATFTYVPPADAKLYKEPPTYDAKLVVGAQAFPLTGPDVAGTTHTWDEFKGKVVLLDFWATWCGPCIGELPNVLKAYEAYHDRGFEIVGVSLDDSKEKLTAFIKENNLTYINLFDGKGWDNVDGKTYGVRAIPFTLLIGKDGKIAAVNPRGEKLEPALLEALAKD